MQLINFDTNLVDRLPQEVFESEEVRLVTPNEVGVMSFQDREVCGVVIGDPSRGCLFLQLANTSPTPRHNFAIRPEVLGLLADYGVRFEALWHSHPPILERNSKSPEKMRAILEAEDRLAGPRPSSFDLDYHPVSKRLMIWYRGVLREFDLTGKEINSWITESAVG